MGKRKKYQGPSKRKEQRCKLRKGGRKKKSMGVSCIKSKPVSGAPEGACTRGEVPRGEYEKKSSKGGDAIGFQNERKKKRHQVRRGVNPTAVPPSPKKWAEKKRGEGRRPTIKREAGFEGMNEKKG